MISVPPREGCGPGHGGSASGARNWVAMTTKTAGTVPIAAVGDSHLGGKGPRAPRQLLFGRVAGHADVLALCGDLTDRGDPEEARLMARALGTVAVPVVAVL